MYNAITRAMEPELLPCLRKFGIRCVIYNATAGGFFANKLTSTEDPGPEGRFNPDSHLGRYGFPLLLNRTYEIWSS